MNINRNKPIFNTVIRIVSLLVSVKLIGA